MPLRSVCFVVLISFIEWQASLDQICLVTFRKSQSLASIESLKSCHSDAPDVMAMDPHGTSSCWRSVRDVDDARDFGCAGPQNHPLPSAVLVFPHHVPW